MANRAAIARLIAQGIDADPAMNQRVLGAAVGRHQATISKWVNATQIPDRDDWPAIETALNLSTGAIAAAYREPEASELDALRARIERLEVEHAMLATFIDERLIVTREPLKPGAAELLERLRSENRR